MNNYSEELKTRYSELYAADTPTDKWIGAKPAVPFVGDQYRNDSRCKVLVYGSAENLTHLAKLSKEEIDVKAPIERNRMLFNQWAEGRTGNRKKSIRNWFPWVHMTPISDGTLLTAARYLLHRFGKEGFDPEPEVFLQQIAVGNYGKFSLNKNINKDYASAQILLNLSKKYVQADLETLSPDVVIMPRTIHMHGLKPIVQDRSQRPEVWRIYQTNSRVINRTIRNQLPAERHEYTKVRPAWSENWCEHTPKSVDMDAYLDWLDWKISTGDGSTKERWPIVFK